jgi:hypothetical protein
MCCQILHIWENGVCIYMRVGHKKTLRPSPGIIGVPDAARNQVFAPPRAGAGQPAGQKSPHLPHP